jgi:hypothetical protein
MEWRGVTEFLDSSSRRTRLAARLEHRLYAELVPRQESTAFATG